MRGERVDAEWNLTVFKCHIDVVKAILCPVASALECIERRNSETMHGTLCTTAISTLQAFTSFISVVVLSTIALQHIINVTLFWH